MNLKLVVALTLSWIVGSAILPLQQLAYGNIFVSQDILTLDAYAPFFRLAKKSSFSFVQPRDSGVIAQRGQACSDGMQVEFQRIGNYSADACRFPKFLVKTKGPSPNFEVFSHPRSFVLLTHCDNEKLEYVNARLAPVREYLAYQWFHHLGLEMLQVRLGHFQYIDTSFSKRSLDPDRYGVLLESFDDMAARLGYAVNRQMSESNSQTTARKFFDAMPLGWQARMVLAQVLIGNWDWRFAEINPTDYQRGVVIHNFLVMERGETALLTPFDFDLSSLVVGYETRNSKDYLEKNEFDPRLWLPSEEDSVRKMMAFRLYMAWRKLPDEAFFEAVTHTETNLSGLLKHVESIESRIDEEIKVARHHLEAFSFARRVLETIDVLREDTQLISEQDGTVVCSRVPKGTAVKVLNRDGDIAKIAVMLKPERGDCGYIPPSKLVEGLVQSSLISRISTEVKDNK